MAARSVASVEAGDKLMAALAPSDCAAAFDVPVPEGEPDWVELERAEVLDEDDGAAASWVDEDEPPSPRGVVRRRS